MGWPVGFDYSWHRDIGYGVPAMCDFPECAEDIDRGLSYVCGNEPYGGEYGCGLYFCDGHLQYITIDTLTGEQVDEDDLDEGESRSNRFIFVPVCERCTGELDPFTPSPDTAEWINHKMTDPSWAKWREEQGNLWN